MSDSIYEETDALRNELKKLPCDKVISQGVVHEAALEVLGEYEHGSADIASLGLKTIKQYKDVLLDFLSSLNVIIEDN